MAPEVLNGSAYNRKCDVYSFGICLWEIYCCDMPYPDLSFLEVTSVAVRQNLRPEIPRCCPNSLASVMKRCWDVKSGQEARDGQGGHMDTKAIGEIGSLVFIKQGAEVVGITVVGSSSGQLANHYGDRTRAHMKALSNELSNTVKEKSCVINELSNTIKEREHQIKKISDCAAGAFVAVNRFSEIKDGLNKALM
ncbi:putative dual-specificity kinase TKL-Pl-4 family [Helianthus anomalus]